MILRNAGRKADQACLNGECTSTTKLVKQGVRDMLRMSDARMSGTSYGRAYSILLQKAILRRPSIGWTGDMVTVDVEKRLIQMEVDDDELKKRAALASPETKV